MIYYLLNYTWGLLTTLIGWIVYLVLMPFSRDRGKYHKSHYLVVGNSSWGGLSIGVCIFVSRNAHELKAHEYGHTWQNAFYGLLMPFIVSIPSVIRYWYFTIGFKRGKVFSPDWYESIWFERQATEWGNNYKYW